MKIVLACEGNSEVALMSALLEQGALIFDKYDIIDRRPMCLRQPKKILPIISIIDTEEDILFCRIGDTQRDVFDIECFSPVRKEHIEVKKYCTMPEIEILIIINEGKFDDYCKNKSNLTPKEYVAAYLKDVGSFSSYVTKHDMVWAIKEYKRIKSHKQKDEYYLADLLK